MQQFMWQPDMLQVAKYLDAGVKRMQEIDPDAGSNPCRTSIQPGWLERCNLLVLSCIANGALAPRLAHACCHAV